MDEQPDLDALARRFLDLWQDQISATWGEIGPELAPGIAAENAGTCDAATAETSRQALEAALAAFTRASSVLAPLLWSSAPALLWEGGLSGGTGPGEGRAGAGGLSAAQRAAAAAGSSGGGAGRLDDVERRLAALEERLAALERGAATEGGRPGKGPGKGTGRKGTGRGRA